MTVSHTPGKWATRIRLRVRAVLAEHEVSASEVARRCGWRQQYLARRLTPTNPVPFSVADLEAIAAALGISPTEITNDREAVAA